MNDDLGFYARSIYGANTRRGLVELRLGSSEVTVEPAKAREMATFMLEAATAAEGDEVLMRVLDRAGLSPQRAAQVLIAMRVERAILERAARAEARRQVAEDQTDEDAPS
ncbi:MAG TPA: hypothetical protein VF076_07070 [Acidimicrobiales bacterium]